MADQNQNTGSDNDEGFGEILDYLTTVGISLPQAITKPEDMAPIAPAVDPALLVSELAELPPENELYAYRRYRVFYGTKGQLPNTLR